MGWLLRLRYTTLGENELLDSLLFCKCDGVVVLCHGCFFLCKFVCHLIAIELLYAKIRIRIRIRISLPRQNRNIIS